MKLINKKRVENLEKVFRLKDGKPNFAMVIYDPAMEQCDLDKIDIDVETVLFLPDNGRDPDYLQIPKGSYKIFY
ncbi:MAG: hypothetical protein JSS32_02725 [Verrucomicrobia bacterium]|nr:hypothetical protein [Verrucomicrobiota bacterium]